MTIRQRLAQAATLSLTVGLGLGSRSALMPGAVRLYVGDVLWGVLFYLLFACLLPRRSDVWRTGAAIAVTVSIEVTQLYQASWARALRASRLGGLLLGHEFLWSDVACVTLGVLLAVGLGPSRLWRRDDWRRAGGG